MKKFLDFTMACCILISGLVSCSNGNDPEEDGNRRDPGIETGKLYTVSLSLGGDYIEESDEPLTKADNASTYVGINVTRQKIHTDASATPEEEQYAHGVFLKKDNISIDLISGYLYSFEATILRDGDDEYRTQSNNDYPQPFRVKEVGATTATGNNYSGGNVNSFLFYDKDKQKNYLYVLEKGNAYVRSGNSTDFMVAEYYYPRVHRYYGKLAGYNPMEGDGTITIDMKYKSFGLRIEAENIPEETYVTWKDKEENENGDYVTLKFPKDAQISANGQSWETVYSLNDLTTDQSKEMTLRFTWHKGAKETETFEKNVTFNAKQKKILKINITGSATTTKTGNIILNILDDSMEDDIVEVEYKGKDSK